MDRREFLSLRNLLPEDTVHDLRRARARNSLSDEEIRESRKELEENDEIDESYKKIMLCLLTVGESFKPQKEVQGKDDLNESNDDADSEEENDPAYELFLEHLKKHDKFYALKYEKDGISVVHKYGEDTDSDEQCDVEPRRKRGRPSKQKLGPSNQRHGVEILPSNALEMTTHVNRSSNVLEMNTHMNQPSNALEMTKRVKRSQTKLANEVEVENTKGSSDVVLASHKECDPEPRRKQNRVGKRKMGPSDQVPNVENRPSDALGMTTHLTRSKTKVVNEVEVGNSKGSPDVVLVSHKDCDPEPSRKHNGVGKPKMGPSNKMPGAENQREHNQQTTSVKKTNGLTSRKSTNEANKVENTKALPDDVLPDLQYHRLCLNVKLEDKDKEYDPDPSRKVDRAGKQKVGPSTKIPHVENRPSSSPDMVLVSHRIKLNIVLRQKPGPSNQTSRAENQRDKKTNGLTRKSINNADMLEVGTAPDRHCHHFHQNIKLEDDRHGHMHKDKEIEPEPSRGVNVEKRKVSSVKGAPNDMVLNSNKERYLQPKSKVSRGMKQNAGPSNQMPAVEIKHKGDQQCNSLKKHKCWTQRKSTDEVKVENMKDSPKDMVPDPEYQHLRQNVKLDDHYGHMHEVNTVVNEKNHGPNDVGIGAKEEIGSDRKIYEVGEVKKECKDAGGSDVEILDSEAIIEAGILSTFVPSKKVHEAMEEHRDCGEFRKQVLKFLRRPFDKDEYMRHQEAAKCYLDRHPDLRRKLIKYRYKQGKRLTIYRGFFFWLQHLTQEGSFKPWKDRECLSVEP